MTGQADGKGWNWPDLLLRLSVPVAIAIGTTYISSQNISQQLAMNRNDARDAVVSDYIQSMTTLVLDRNLAKANPDQGVAVVARTLTLTALSRVGDDSGELSVRKAEILKFLQEAGLIDTQSLNVSLAGANLSRADLRGANLRSADLREVNLRSANLMDADLSIANLSGSVLKAANLRGADLNGVNFNWANLRGANLAGANINGAILGWADLAGATCPNGKASAGGC